MPALSNPKWEAFCQAYVRGKTAGNATASFKQAGFKGDRRKASKLLQRGDISGRVAELRDQVIAIEEKATTKAIERLGLSKEKVMAELMKLGFSNMLDYVRVLEGTGDIAVDLSRLDEGTAAAITEVVVDTYLEGHGDQAREVKRVRFKLADKRGALVDLAKLAGYHLGERLPGAQGEQTLNVNVKAELVDRPPRETFKQWEARRAAELAGKHTPRKPEKKR